MYASFPKGNDDNVAKFAGMLVFLVRMTPQSQAGDGDTHMILLILEGKKTMSSTLKGPLGNQGINCSETSQRHLNVYIDSP
jgi:hypothetical protein